MAAAAVLVVLASLWFVGDAARRSLSGRSPAAATPGRDRAKDRFGEPGTLQPVDRARLDRDRHLAILTRAVDVVWEEGRGPVIGSSLAECALRLRSGVLQLEFYSGAIVVVEGPAEIELKAIDRVALRSGKLRARVPTSAQGFRVTSPTLDLVDRGTEFGMQVVPGRNSEVHVFDGKVELQETSPRQERAAPWELAGGHGVRIDATGKVAALAADSFRFLALPELEKRYQEMSRQKYQSWAAGSVLAPNTNGLVTYFPFEGDRRLGSRVLTNTCGDRPTDGAIVGCEWVSGRWPGKGALEFKRPSDRIRFRVPCDFESLTLAAWVRIDSIDNRFNSLMLSDGFDYGHVHWQIDCFGRVVLGIRLEPDKPSKASVYNHDYNSPVVFTPGMLGRWVHLATVFDREGKTVSHYVNGAEVSHETTVDHGVLRIGSAELGNWYVPPGHLDRTPIRNLCGRIDEFVLFRVPLGPEEVRDLYDRGVPDP